MVKLKITSFKIYNDANETVHHVLYIWFIKQSSEMLTVTLDGTFQIKDL
jgi:hypothetical protein